MAGCERIRPLLYRAAEGEATPAEAMLVARHMPTCTACRILLARESRLAQLLETGLDDPPVDERFVRDVMATLPDRPSVRRPVRGRKRRGLKLAGLVGIALLGLTMGPQGTGLPTAATGLAAPRVDGGGLEGLVGGLAALAKVLLLAIDALAARAPVVVPLLSRAPEFALVLAGTALAVAAVASSLCVVAAGCWFRLREPSASA